MSGDAELKLVATDKAPAKAAWAKVPKRVQALGIKVSSCGGSPGWFVGLQPSGDGHDVVIVSKTGKVTQPEPAILARLAKLESLPEGFTVVGTPTDPLLEAGKACFELSGVEAALARAFS